MLKSGLSIFCVIILILCFCADFSFGSSPEIQADWDEYRSDHFIIYYHSSISDDYIRDFARKCEQYYHSIADWLGFSRFNFWLWENRAKIFVYKARQDYLNDTNRPEWSQATAHIRKKFINTYYFEPDFFDIVLPHELTHIILREFIGLNTPAPLWFDEGIACVNESGSRSYYLSRTKELVAEGRYVPLPELEMANQQTVTSPGVFYPTAASLVIFLLEDYNKEYFVELCRELRDGTAFYRAMDKVYGIRDAKDLNDNLLNFLTNTGY